jgi:integrase
VPLSAQSLAALRQLKQLTGTYQFIFAGRNDVNKPMSEASINMVIKRIGYDKRATGHGFRHTMSTILHEEGFNTAWIETSSRMWTRTRFAGPITMRSILKGGKR